MIKCQCYIFLYILGYLDYRILFFCSVIFPNELQVVYSSLVVAISAADVEGAAAESTG